jgi:G:T-mismatch repair DNA endonuclease (very short patch repair protein)
LLSEQGWQPLVVWECQTRDISSLRKQLCLFLG